MYEFLEDRFDCNVLLFGKCINHFDNTILGWFLRSKIHISIFDARYANLLYTYANLIKLLRAVSVDVCSGNGLKWQTHRRFYLHIRAFHSFMESSICNIIYVLSSLDRTLDNYLLRFHIDKVLVYSNSRIDHDSLISYSHIFFCIRISLMVLKSRQVGRSIRSTTQDHGC